MMFRNQPPMRPRSPWLPPQRGPGLFGGDFGGPGYPGRSGPPTGGGILSRLFQRSTPTTTSMFSRGPETTSVLQNLANPQKINQFLSQSQQVLNTAQQFGPMIKQYGPMIKNLPAMWRLYQSFKNLPSSDEQQEHELKEQKLDESADPILIESSEAESSMNNRPRKKHGESVPKLYV